MENQISIINLPKISALYFALLQSGYDYYAVEKPPLLTDEIERFCSARETEEASFFSQVRQSECEAYPYWPRAAMLESATFFTGSNGRFCNFDEYRTFIMTAANLSDSERDTAFWRWVRGFPDALNKTLSDARFQAYLAWENDWIERQNLLFQNELAALRQIIAFCKTHYTSPLQKLSVVLNPIKCAYSADCHLAGDRMFFCSGAFSPKSAVHEFLHHIVHPHIIKHKEIISQQDTRYPEIDKSYYLTGDERGRLNAFEEYAVRRLTNLALENNLPAELHLFINDLLTV